ncbi:hypothetical protein N7448_003398 [Penicillium atrosanguineum]|nr:hypothetical protein N7526_009203 [Penicillium atrosanguineum]KAJ5139990.1 hypothetical protein N7448_003398 [Penicillium atrosanguineum]
MESDAPEPETSPSLLHPTQVAPPALLHAVPAMSLNGLDNPAVVEAYQSALADAGGWILLHYTARDEVALLDRGTGGVSEVRNAIDNYEETSPLYGFLQYRRRKVILRYMPEGLSRLIQARSNVQFQSVLDKFTPNDTVLALTQASELNESALSSACLLHTASGSITSSSSSLRRRRLMEITEDAEESGTKEETKEQGKGQEQPPPSITETRQRSGSLKSEATVVPPTASPEEKSSPDLRPPPSRASSRAPSIGSPSESRSTMSPISPDSGSERSKYRNILDEFPRPSEEISNEPPGFNLRSNWDLVPLSTLLEGLVLPGLQGTPINVPSPRSPWACARLHCEDLMLTPLVPDPKEAPSRPNRSAEPPPIPPLLVPPPNIPISRPQLSPGAKSLGALSTSSGLTPEKERLMKALQQRKKQMAKRAEATKKKQNIEEEPIAELDTLTPNEEDKENINLVPGQETPGLEKARDDQDEKPIELSLPAPEPLKNETAEPEPQTEPQEEEFLSSAVFKPEPPTEVDLEGKRSSNIFDPSVDTTFSTDHDELSLDTVQSETPQTVSEDETRAEDTDSAIPGQNETKDDLVPPSANPEVPLDKESTETSSPFLELQDTSSSHQSDAPLMDNEPLDAPPVDAGPAEAPESTPRPDTSPAVAPLNPEIEPSVAPVSHSIGPVPAAEATPEEPLVEKINPIPLDQRRKVHLEPIQVHTPEHSEDDDNLSDDSFMEELRSATVQEARPVSVKTPGDQSWPGSRAVSSPYSLASPAMQSFAVGRSVSSSYSENGPSTPLLVAKKVNVSSGISSRIKALEKFQSREGTPPSGTQTVTGPSASSSFDSLRKRASVSYGSPESYSRAPSLNRKDSHSSPNVRRTGSISVTARIVRDNGVSPGSNGVEPTESDVLGLQASPLTVQHGSSEELLPTSESVESIPQPEDRSMSFSSAGSNITPASASRPTSRPSLSSRTKTDENLQATSPTTEEKRASRASRIMRRMSSMTTTSRRSIIGALSPPAKEDINPMDTKPVSASSSRSRVSEPIDIGEVNVQFPDTLLWKRRFMRIDENGYVVLTPGTNDASARNMTKRYHLSEFRTPCLPDEDMQELPNSILLDFSDGSTLQCACESRQGQSSALQTLIDAHSAHQQ